MKDLQIVDEFHFGHRVEARFNPAILCYFGPPGDEVPRLLNDAGSIRLF